MYIAHINSVLKILIILKIIKKAISRPVLGGVFWCWKERLQAIQPHNKPSESTPIVITTQAHNPFVNNQQRLQLPRQLLQSTQTLQQH